MTMDKKLHLFLENMGHRVLVPDSKDLMNPERLTITLHDYQKAGLYFMKTAEESSTKGGILADEMGVGKTLQAVALVLTRPATATDDHDDTTAINHSSNGKGSTTTAAEAASTSSSSTSTTTQLIKTKATLVVCPKSVVNQWNEVLATKTSPPLRVYIHHGAKRIKTSADLAAKEYDVIITTFDIVPNEVGDTAKPGAALGGIKFHRVILDEAHIIRNHNTAIKSKACCRLEADYRWCLTGTPVQNKIEDLYSLIKFLRIKPYCDFREFNKLIKEPFEGINDEVYDDENDKSISKLQALLKSITLRRNKTVLPTPLPPRNVHMIEIDFSASERAFYDSLTKRAVARTDDIISTDKKLKVPYSCILALLTKLKQACLHPRLASNDNDEAAITLEEHEHLDLVRSVPREAVKSLLREMRDVDKIECPLCEFEVEEPRVIPRCGHIVCRICVDYIKISGSKKSAEEEHNCPQCGEVFMLDKMVSLELFLKVYAPGLYKEFFGEQAVEEATRAEDLPTSAKINKMLEILENTRRTTRNEDKTIIFSQYTSFLDLLEEPLTQHGFNFVRLDGDTRMQQRDQVMKKFENDANITVFLISLRAGGCGLNLTAANHVILMDFWWNPAVEDQAIDRVHRQGQTKAVHVHRIFINQTIEDKILDIQARKQVEYNRVLAEGGQSKIDKFSAGELVELFQGLKLDKD